MFARIVSMVFIAFSAALAGCAVPMVHPNQVQATQAGNAVGGAVVGGALGALIGDNSRAARVGAGIGALIGATTPVYPAAPMYRGQPNYGTPGYGFNAGAAPRPMCPPNSVWDGWGCRIMHTAPRCEHPQPFVNGRWVCPR